MGEESDVVGDDGKRVCNKIRFWQDRTFINKIYRLIYKQVRFWYVVFYFYFYPLLLIFGNAFASFYFAKANQKPSSQAAEQVA